MKYELPELPPDVTWLFGGPADPMPKEHYTADQMRQYAEQAVAPLLAEIERLKRGEFICNKCFLRKDAKVGAPDF